MRLIVLPNQYFVDIFNRYREVLTLQDTVMKRNPIHYAAMSKFTNSFKTMEAILDIELDHVPGYDSFLHLYFQFQCFELAEETFDPRCSANVLNDYKKLVKPSEWNTITKEFKHQASILLKEVLN